MHFPKKVKIVEVSPRDGLQNEKKILPTQIKIDFINRLSETGLKVIEATSFVSPKWIPQLADHETVFKKIKKFKNISYRVLVPNAKGFENALKCDVEEISVFTTPSELFSKHNTNMTVAESLKNIELVIKLAKKNHLKVRGYLSCVLGCPYQGKMDPKSVTALAEKLLALGCYEISLGDTIGVGTPSSTQKLLNTLFKKISPKKLAVHFHDTYGQALANIYVALEKGIATIDSSVAGLGGCPYAKGASGNVATEDVIYMLQGMNIKTGVDLEKIIKVGQWITHYLNRESRSKVATAKQ